jgi:hypothetical protein
MAPEFNTAAHPDSIEAIMAVASVKALSDNAKDCRIDLTI